MSPASSSSSSSSNGGSYSDRRPDPAGDKPVAPINDWENDDQGLEDDLAEDEALLAGDGALPPSSRRRPASTSSSSIGNPLAAGVGNGSNRRGFLVAGAGAALVVVIFAILFVGPAQKRGGTNGGRNRAQAQLVQFKARFDVARHDMESSLRRDYGTYYDAMFTRTVTVPAAESDEDKTNEAEEDSHNRRSVRRVHEEEGASDSSGAQKTKVVSIGRIIFQSPTFQEHMGPDRMRNKIKRKLLQVLLHQETSSSPITFVWATGGHSSSAGHGNLYNESYTATLERTAKDVFAAAGIHLEGRNRAMGGTNSFPEIAICGQEVFGLDIDVMSWDYGMTDGDETFGTLQYFYRTVHHPNRPAGVILRERNDPQWDDGRSSKRVLAMRELERAGMAALLVDEDQCRATTQAIPEVFDILADGEAAAEALPPMVKYFKCEGGLETGDLCGPHKYTVVENCTHRNKQASWHEGFKWHGMMGNLMALGMVEFLSDALDELLAVASDPELPPLDPAQMLAELQAIEDAEYKEFLKNPLPDMTQGMVQKYPRNEDGGGYELDQMYVKPAFCHIALVPSQYRFLGILTDTQTQLGQDNYEQGISLQHVFRNPEDLYPPDESGSVPEFMRLAYDEDEREGCWIPTYIDYKDFFLVRQVDDWKKVVVPTDAAIRAYPNKDPTTLEGRIAFCTTPWSTAGDNDIHFDKSENFADGGLELQVNGVAVAGVDKVRHCYTLRHESGAVFPADVNGKFTIRARVTSENHYIKFTSFIVW